MLSRISTKCSVGSFAQKQCTVDAVAAVFTKTSLTRDTVCNTCSFLGTNIVTIDQSTSLLIGVYDLLGMVSLVGVRGELDVRPLRQKERWLQNIYYLENRFSVVAT